VWLLAQASQHCATGELWLPAPLSGFASLAQIIFLQTRPRLPHSAALLSSCMDGYIYAWSIHGSGGLLGKFPVDSVDEGDVVVGAMATDQNDWILVTGDCKGCIKVRKNWPWDRGAGLSHALASSLPSVVLAPSLCPLGTRFTCNTVGGGVGSLRVLSCPRGPREVKEGLVRGSPAQKTSCGSCALEFSSCCSLTPSCASDL